MSQLKLSKLLHLHATLHKLPRSISINFIKLRANTLKNIAIPPLEQPSNILKRTCDAIFLTTFYLCEQKITLKYFHQTVLVTKSLKVGLKVCQLQKCQIVTKVPLSDYNSAYERDKSSLSMLRKFPKLRKSPIFVTKVPFFGDKSARSYGSLSLSLSVFILPRLQVNFKIISKLIYQQMKENLANELLTTLYSYIASHCKLTVPNTLNLFLQQTHIARASSSEGLFVFSFANSPAFFVAST